MESHREVEHSIKPWPYNNIEVRNKNDPMLRKRHQESRTDIF
jgi:hypothetical protein